MGDHRQNPTALARQAAPPGAAMFRYMKLDEGFGLVGARITMNLNTDTRELTVGVVVDTVHITGIIGHDEVVPVMIMSMPPIPLDQLKEQMEAVRHAVKGENGTPES